MRWYTVCKWHCIDKLQKYIIDENENMADFLPNMKKEDFIPKTNESLLKSVI